MNTAGTKISIPSSHVLHPDSACRLNHPDRSVDVHPIGGEFVMASISERENREIQAAGASGRTPVVFIHGLRLLPGSRASWADLFQQAGYAPLTPDRPDDPQTVDQARANPRVLAGRPWGGSPITPPRSSLPWTASQRSSGARPGGLLAQMLAGRGLSAVTVAIGPGVFRGVLPPPASVLRGVGPFLVNPLTRGRAITLTFGPFTDGWASALQEKEARELYEAFHVAGPGISLAQRGNANLNPRTEAKVSTASPGRGPLLIIDGAQDHTVPWAIASAAYERQKRHPAVTEIVKMPDRGHCLTIDHRWREVAQTALGFVRRYA
jgi:non-heme chloroperoxidase